MKKIFLAFAVLFIVIGAMYFTQNYLKKPSTATIGDHNFKVALAVSQQEREIGLSNTKSLSQDQGMVFLFDKPGYYSFWMKNMKFPIDIIYINQDTIITIRSNVQPPKDNNGNLIVYTSEKPSDKVLEIQAGLSEKYNFKNGDKVKYENLGN